MAYCTKTDLRNQVIYSIYVRNYSEEGTFLEVEKDLDRIKGLGRYHLVSANLPHRAGKAERHPWLTLCHCRLQESESGTGYNG